MRSLYVKGKYSKYINQNIYKAISSMFPNLSIGNLNKVFRLKDVKVNSIRVEKSYILKENDFIEIYLSDALLFGTSFNIQVVYEDNNILVALKPIKMASCNESHKYKTDDVYFENVVRNNFGSNLFICHRLDTNTKGLVIFAKNSAAYKEILNAFKEHNISKKYLALVHGKLQKKSDILKAYHIKNNINNTVKIYSTPVKHSEEIITEYNTIEYFANKNLSLLEVTLHTGKTHQIRAHLSYIGHPVIGDPKYSTNEINKNFRQNHQALIAYCYEFNFNEDSFLNYLNDIVIQLDKCEVIKEMMEKI